jgi:hypothetical protein
MYYLPTNTMSITISRMTGEKREFQFSPTLTFGEIQKVLWGDDGFNCSSFFKEGDEDKIQLYLPGYRRIHNNATMDSLGITPETKLFALPSGGDEPHAREFITLTMNEPSGRTRTIRISYNESILCLSNYWKNEFGSYVDSFFIEGVEDPLEWKSMGTRQTLADNYIRSDKNIFVIETDKWRCFDCGGTTTWRGTCIGCYPGNLQDLCIHGDGIVSLRDGTTSRVKDLLVGDTVLRVNQESEKCQPLDGQSSHTTIRSVLTMNGLCHTNLIHPVLKHTRVWYTTSLWTLTRRTKINTPSS